MKQIFKKMAAGALSICMLFTGTGMQTMAGELNPEEMRPVYDDSESAEGSEEVLTNDPARYLLHIPIGEGYQLTYDTTHLDNEKTEKPEEEIYLSYKANEQVSVGIQSGEGYSVDAIKVLDSETELEETVQEFKYEESTLTFQMPEKDIDIKVAVTALSAQEETSGNTGDTGSMESSSPNQTQTDPSQVGDSEQATEETTDMNDGTNVDSETTENEVGTDGSDETQGNDTQSEEVEDSEEKELSSDDESSESATEEEVDLTDPSKDSAEQHEGEYHVDLTSGSEFNVTLNKENGWYQPGETVSFTSDIPAGTLVAVEALRVNGNAANTTADILYAEVTYNEADNSFSFEMPEDDIDLRVTLENIGGSEEDGIMLTSEDDLWDESTEIEANTYYYYSDGTLHPFNSVMGYGGNDSYKYIRYKVNGKTYTVYAYCMQHSKTSPPSGTTYTKMIELDEKGDDVYLRKALFYGYGGPGWGQTFNGCNIKTIMENAGCTTEMRAMQHYLVDYLYDGESGFGGALSATAQNMLKNIKAALKKMPDPTSMELLPTLSTKATSNTTETFTWKANEAFTITIHLEKGVSLVNETTGKTGTGNVTVKGGDKFHLVADSSKMSSLKGSYDITSNYPLNFHAMLLKLTTAQDIGFGYYTDSSDISLTVDWPEDAVVEIIKSDNETGKNLAGAVYGIYSDAACKNLIQQMPATDANGHSQVTLTKTQDTVYLKEISNPSGYKVDAKSYNIKLVAGQTTTTNVGDDRVKATINLKKVDKETGKEAQGETTFEGAVYGLYAKEDIVHPDSKTGTVYKKDDLVATLTVDKDGNASVSNLYCGKYYVKEITAPEGYEPDEEIHDVDCSYENGSTEINRTVTSQEQIKRGDVSLMKYIGDDMSESEIQKVYDSGILAGIVFTFTSADKGTEISIATDKFGYATTSTEDKTGLGALTYGKWTITESNTPKGYEGIEATEIMVDGTDRELKFVVYNKEVNAYIQIMKKDSETGNTITRSGAKFQILDADGKAIEANDPNDYSKITDTFTTNADGIILLPRPLGVGTYTLVEVEPPKGYMKSDDITFKVEAGHTSTDPLVIECKDVPQKGKLKLTKVDDKTNETIGAGFVYEIKVLEDITDGAGEIRTGTNVKGEKVELKAGIVVDLITTDENGVAESKELYTGKYVVTEKTSGEYYSKSKTEYPAEITADSSNEEVTVEIIVKNEKTSFDLLKVDSTEDKVLEGITFRIWSDEEAADSTEQTEGTENTETEQTGESTETAQDTEATEGNISEATEETEDSTLSSDEYITDAEGRIHIENLKHDTTYHVQEVKTLDGYNLDPTVYDFHVDEAGLINGQPSYEMKLTNQPNVLEISKKDITQKEELPGATLIVYNADKTEEIEKWVSAEEPHIIKGLAAGTYILHEEIAPENYSLAEDIEFTLTDSLKVNHVIMYDDLIQVEISKVDITTEKELPGAELVVTDSNGNEVEKWTSSTEPHKFNLAAGVYTLTEKTAPDKYATAESIQFEVTAENTVQKVTMKDAPLTVEISKQDITNKEELEGAHMKVETLDGEVIEEWTSTKEPHKMKLSKGKYILTEITAPKGYDVAESIKFEVTDTAEVQRTVMYDKPTDGLTNLTGKKNTTTTTTGGGGSTPASEHGGTSSASPVKTGDNTPLALYALMLVAAGVAAGAGFYIRKRKRGGSRQ